MAEKETNKYKDLFTENQNNESTQADEFSKSDPSVSSEEPPISDFERNSSAEVSDSGIENSTSEHDTSCCYDSTSNNRDAENNCTKQFTLYAGLSVVILFFLFIYNFLEIRSLNSELVTVTGKLNAMSSSISKFESATFSLEIKKSILIIDELISRGNKTTKDAAEKAKLNLIYLSETLKK